MPLLKPDPEFTLEIEGTELKGWQSMTFRRAIDSADAVTFTAPFDPKNKKHRDWFRPAMYREIVLRYGGKKVFTGTAHNPTPTNGANSTTVQVSAISKCGVWQDCTMPAGTPLQFDGFTLKKIATALADPFGLTPQFPDGDGAPFDKATLEPEGNPLQFLAELAKQRGLVIGSDENGNPLFWKSVDLVKPVAEFLPDSQPAYQISPQFDDQKLFSEVTGLAKSKHGKTGSKYSEGNFHIQDATRPHTFSLNDTEPADVPAAVQTKIARQFGEAIGYSISSATILDQGLKNLYDRNTIVRVKEPKVMIYAPFDFLIRAVQFNVTAKDKTADIEIVLPTAFSGIIPEALPWDEAALF